MKMTSVLNKFRKNGLQFEQVESGSSFYVCKHELVENTYVQVLTKSNGVDVSTMAIVQQYDEQSESKTFFSTINGLLESFMLDVNRAEEKAVQAPAQPEPSQPQPEPAPANNDGFTIERNRASVTQCWVKVSYNGVEVAVFGDNIRIIEDGEEFYGDMIAGWASVVSDETFIDSIRSRPTKELLKEVNVVISPSNFELSHHDDELHVYYRGVYITTYEVRSEPAASHFINYTIEIYREKLERIELTDRLIMPDVKPLT